MTSSRCTYWNTPMIRQSIKKLKNNIESKHKESVRIKNKVVKLIEELKESDNHADKTRIQNLLYKLKSDMKALESELNEMKEEVYGSWAPKKDK